MNWNSNSDKILEKKLKYFRGEDADAAPKTLQERIMQTITKALIKSPVFKQKSTLPPTTN